MLRTAAPSALGMLLRASLVVLLGAASSGGRAEDAPPSFAELEAAGARIGEIRIVVNDVFDTSDPKENKWPFRWANGLHIRTRAGVVARSLLFKSGDPFSVQKLEETERFLRGRRYLYDVRFRVLAYRDGVVDLEVSTRDTWTLDAGASIGRTGGGSTPAACIWRSTTFWARAYRWESAVPAMWTAPARGSS